LEKSFVVVVGLMVVLTIGFVFFALPKAGGPSSEKAIGLYARDSGGLAAGPAAQQLSVREITVEATNFKFEPSQIKVRQGERVRLTLKNAGGTHGISVPSLGIDLQAGAGESKTVEFTAGKPGSHPFLCHLFCGSGHADMTGAIVVEDAQGNAGESPSEVRVRGTANGFSPSTFSVKAGKPVKISFSADGDAGCAKLLVLRGTDIKLVSANGETAEASFVPAAGNHAFTCAMGMFTGVISAS